MLRFLKQYYPIRNIFFYVIEGLVIFGSFFLASFIMTEPDSIWSDLLVLFKIMLITIICQIFLYYNDLYDFKISSTLPEIIIRLLQALGVTLIIFALIYFFFPVVMIEDSIFMLSIVFVIVFIVGWRVIYFAILDKGVFNEKILILGSSKLAMGICHEIETRIDCGYSVVAMVTDSDTKDVSSLSGKILVLSSKCDLCETVSAVGAGKIVVALTDSRAFFPTKELLKCKVAGVDVMEGNTFYETLTGKLLVRQINPSWLIFSDGFKKSFLKSATKRISDIIVSLALMLVLFPFFIFFALLIKFDSRGPALFSQIRVGQKKKEYAVYKLRSMVDNAEEESGPVWAREADPRITRIGKFLRRFRIDEFPQLWNVFIGNMSMIGPRPERKHFTDELEKKIPYYSERFLVKPGITGWAQVSFVYGGSIDDAEEKLNYDLFYVKNMSLMFDLLIILRTIKTVFFHRGAR